MAVPVYVTGQVLAASDCNQWFLPLEAYKTSATSRSSTTPLIDPDLQVTVAASAVYAVYAAIGYQNPTGASAISWSFQIPAGATGSYGGAYVQPGPVTNAWWNTFAATVSAAASDNLFHGLSLQGTLTTSGTSGTFGLVWAPSTGSAGAVQIGASSNLICQRVG